MVEIVTLLIVAVIAVILTNWRDRHYWQTHAHHEFTADLLITDESARTEECNAA